MINRTETIEAQNEKSWAEFNAKSERIEAAYQQTMAKINRRYVFQGRLICVVLILQVVWMVWMVWKTMS